MNEHFLQSKTDSTIDMRGDIPDFTSATELFTYTLDKVSEDGHNRSRTKSFPDS